MDDSKRVYREVEEKSKEAWRKQDGEDVADKIGNAGDEIRKNLGNVGDDARHTEDDLRRGSIDDPGAVPPDTDRPM